jgi:hypothetical protein
MARHTATINDADKCRCRRGASENLMEMGIVYHPVYQLKEVQPKGTENWEN